MNYPHVLIVSNNSISKTGSNGRTLANLFFGWPKDCLAQFCISTDEPDYGVCDNYYLVTDKSALDGFLHFRKAKRCNIDTNLYSKGNSKMTAKKVVCKSPLTVIVRNLIWQPKRWKSNNFVKWIDDFKPELILLMNTDSLFMLKVATDLSKERKIPIVMYNTEGFYFFEKPFIKSSRYERLLFCLYQSFYKQVFAKTMKKVALSIYLNSKLQSDYDKVFRGRSMIIYTGSKIKPSNDYHPFNFQKPVFSYIGNLAYSRIDALIEVAEVLQSINTNYILDIYGQCDDITKEKVGKCSGISLKGFVPYEKVIKIIEHSDILFHAETHEEKWAEALKYGFSTKIADSVCSGKSFVMYSSPDIAGADYIIKTGAGWFASNKDELKRTIITIINNKSEREKVLSKAKKIALQYHQAQKNSETFQKALINIIDENNNYCEFYKETGWGTGKSLQFPGRCFCKAGT